jgi:hypothetical protein
LDALGPRESFETRNLIWPVNKTELENCRHDKVKYISSKVNQLLNIDMTVTKKTISAMQDMRSPLKKKKIVFIYLFLSFPY